MAIADLSNAPSLLGDESKKLRELMELGSNRTNIGSGTYTSTTSGIGYNYTGGEDGLYTVIKNALDGYNLSATAWNSITDSLDGFSVKSRTRELLQDVTLDASTEIIGGVLRLKDEEIIDRTTPEQVVATANTTQGNGGRKITRLSNGWIVTASYNSSNQRIEIAVDKLDGNGFNILGYDAVTSPSDWAIASEGTNCYLVRAYASANVFAISWDMTEATGNNNLNTLTSYSSNVIVSSQTATGNISLAINDENGADKIACLVNTKNATYPNSFNIIAIQGTISGGVVTWGSVEQLSIDNTTGNDYTSPSAIYKNDNFPAIYSAFKQGANYFVYSHNYNGSTWDKPVLYAGGTYIQSNPSATFMPPSVVSSSGIDLGNPTDNANALINGIIFVAWHGLQSADAGNNRIRCRISVDGGTTWIDFGVTNEEIISEARQNQLASISWNNNGEIFIDWQGYIIPDFTYNIKRIKYSNGSWGAILNKTTGTTATRLNVNSINNFHNFEESLILYQDNVDSDVKFSGKWTEGAIQIDGTATEQAFIQNLISWDRLYYTATVEDPLQVVRISVYDETNTTLLKVIDAVTTQPSISISDIDAGIYPTITLRYHLDRFNASFDPPPSPTLSLVSISGITQQSFTLNEYNDYRDFDKPISFATNTYSITMNNNFDYTINGNMLTFNPSATNTGSTSIDINSTGAKLVKKWDGVSAYINIEAGDITQNHHLKLRWDIVEDAFILSA